MKAYYTVAKSGALSSGDAVCAPCGKYLLFANLRDAQKLINAADSATI